MRLKMKATSIQKVAEAVKRNKSFLITTHTNPEGDALGAELAFYLLLKSLGKKSVIINDDILPYGFGFLPCAGKIKQFSKKMTVFDFDCLVMLDCSDLKRCGQVYKLNIYGRPVINIDHHISNVFFGEFNLVNPGASSASEIVYDLFKEMNVALTKDIATLLYVGIVTDTGSFHYSNTSSFTHSAVAQLLRYGIDVTSIYRKLYEEKPFKDLKLLVKMLSDIKLAASGKIAWVALEDHIPKNRNLSFDLSERVLGFARSIKGIEVAVLFKKIQSSRLEVHVNFRSQGKVDVNKIAGFFGGGGHRAASGCTVTGSMEQVKKKVLDKIIENLR